MKINEPRSTFKKGVVYLPYPTLSPFPACQSLLSEEPIPLSEEPIIYTPLCYIY